MIEKIFNILEKYPKLYNAFHWSLIKYLRNKNKCIVDKHNLEFIIYLLTNMDINIYEYDYLEELCDYNISNIKNSDVVLNIGAGAGLHAIISAIICKHVYVIEPILKDIIAKNIKESKLSNKITILNCAFGKDGTTFCNYWGRITKVESKSLNTLLNELIPSPTYIKCDCEGCEFDGFLNCNSFKNVRYIELEYHTNDKQKLKLLMSHFESNNFSVNVIQKIPVEEYKYIGILRAYKKSQ